ncbi:ARM repeat-containing protein [Patellaria atrata CBS 101060]|uniref:ARM repeat-containing protein n=1 Tax=Patellaria atrata CBS 101060 TaxID=1346257 RepID=A0A9P4VQ26_9PEZI|nr:ARM repeat-containing protein [Patellaria atrata CBS 101060]
MDRRRKRELRDLNLRVWAGENDILPVQKSLDSSMKKNTAFIKRVRTSITAPSQGTFLQEIRTLSLHKYLSEIISACYEGLCKVKTPEEIATALEIISALHQRFGPTEFTGYIGWLIGRGLSTPDKAQLKSLPQDVREREEKERLTRQRGLLRVATELWLVGVLRSLEDVTRPEDAVKGKDSGKTGDLVSKARANPKADKADAEPFPLEVLKDMLGHDREHVNLPLVVLFVKTFAWDVLGVKISSAEKRRVTILDTSANEGKSEDQTSTDEDAAVSKDPPFTSAELRQRFKNILTRYFEDVKQHLIRDQKHLVAQGRRNAEAYVKSGEVFEDRQANYEKQTRAQEKLLSNAQFLADALGADLPDLKEKESTIATGEGSIGLVKTAEFLRGQGEGAGIWEDEDERRFYENLIDLKDRVPGILLEDTKKKKVDVDEPVGKKQDDKPAEVEQPEKTESAPETRQADSEDGSTAIANKSVGAQVDALLARLPDFTSKDMVDETAVDFCFLNSKASRNRLIKAVQDVPKARSDLLPFYSRLVATLGKYMTDISNGLVSHLDDEFRSLQRRKQKDFLGQVRMLNVRYLAELTKFGVVPEHVIFHCLKVSLDDFSRMNIEIISSLLENCGRYLLRNPETSPRMTSFLETLQRKKAAQHLGQQERMLIENSIYYINPPERAAIEQKERTPTELFLRKLIYLDLNRRNLDKIVKQFRKLHWEEKEIVSLLLKIFTKPGKIKYSNIHLLAVILSSLNRYHQDFTILVIDDLLETITFGLELNDFKYNQRRIAEVKYFGELYIYRMIDSPLIFDTMYKILTFGHEGGTPRPGVINPLDLPDDFFRIRLICTLLEICGVFFEKGAAKKKLDFFLTFFQYYLFTKDPLPMDIEFIVQDAFALIRPQWKIVDTLEEAGTVFAEVVKQNYQSSATEKSNEIDERDEEVGSGEEDDDDDVKVDDREDQSSSEEAETAADDGVKQEAESSSESEEEQIVVTRQEDERDPEADADFDRELAKMMAESLDSRKFERKSMFDVPLPMRRAQRDISTAAEDGGGEPTTPSAPENTMKFSLLSKRGNRQQTRSIDLPSDSNFAIAMRTQQQAERAEQQRIKSLVLNYDLRDENDIDNGESAISFNRSHNFFLPNYKTKISVNSQLSRTKAHTEYYESPGSIDKANNASYGPVRGERVDKAGNTRSNQRSRKLQLSDVDWYDNSKVSLNVEVAEKMKSTSDDCVNDAGFKRSKRSRSGIGRGKRTLC